MQLVYEEGRREQRTLAEAFRVFSSSSKALEASYLALGEKMHRLRKELEHERDLRKRREALAEISAVLAHEIRNPLGSLELFAGLLTGSPLDSQQAGWAAQVQSGIRILGATVSNILEFHSPQPLAAAPTELNALLLSIQALLAPVFEMAGLEWRADPAPEALWIMADRHRLEQAFMNLALNAVRFAAEGKLLRVSTSCQGRVAVVNFEDRGPGIPSDLLETIFESGVRSASGGIGMGLAVTRQIVELHQGSISVASTPGQGTCFRLEFPGGRS